MKLAIADEESVASPVWEGGQNKILKLPTGGSQVTVGGTFHTKDRWPSDPDMTLIDTFRHFWSSQNMAMPSLFDASFVHSGTSPATWKELIFQEAVELPSLLAKPAKATWAKQGWDT